MNIVNQLNVQLFSDTSMYIYLNYANIFFISGLLIVISTEKQNLGGYKMNIYFNGLNLFT